MSLSREQMLVEMGISPIWVRRDAPVAEPADEAPRQTEPAPSAAPVVEAPPVAAPLKANPVTQAKIDVANLDWPALAKQVAECRACALCEQRKQAVLGVGDIQPEYLFIGEGPGAEEDAQGEPFVGQAGKLLDNMLAAIGLSRQAGDAIDSEAAGADQAGAGGQNDSKRGVYIANVLKCRPPGNRNPQPDEIAQCEPYLRRQVALVQPRVILAMGRFAVQSLLQTSEPIGRLRGRVHHYAGVPVIVTYHPAYLLRALPDKAKAWQDLCLALEVMGGQDGR